MDLAKTQNTHLKGIGYIILSAFFYAIVDIVSRFAGSEISAMQKGFIRNVVVSIFSASVLIRSGNYFHFKKKNTGWFLLRAACGVVVSFGNIYAVDHMLVADATIINKLSPLFIIVFSFLILKEKMNGVHVAVIVIGFIGSLFVIKPTGDFSALFPALIALAAAIALGVVYPIVRKLRQDGENAMMIIFFFTTFAALFSLPFYIRSHVKMSLFQFVMIVLSGIFNCLAQLAASQGYAICPARDISVYDYSQIVFAAAFALMFFGQMPDYLSLIGYVIIIGTSVFLFIYEKRRSAEADEKNERTAT